MKFVHGKSFLLFAAFLFHQAFHAAEREPGVVFAHEVVAFRHIKDLNQHGVAFADLGLGIPLLRQIADEAVDVRSLDFVEGECAKPCFEKHQRVPVGAVCGRSHLTFVAGIPVVSVFAKVPDAVGMDQRTVGGFLFNPVAADLVQHFAACRGGKVEDVALAVVAVAVHDLAAPYAAGRFENGPLLPCSLMSLTRHRRSPPTGCMPP